MGNRPYVSSRPEDGNPLRYWYVDDLIEESRDLPVLDINIHDLGELDRVAWYGAGSHQGRLTVRQVADHIQRIEEADLSHPIILSADGKLLDGFHRVAKAYRLGIDTLPAKRFPVDPQPCDEKNMLDYIYDTYIREKRHNKALHTYKITRANAGHVECEGTRSHERMTKDMAADVAFRPAAATDVPILARYRALMYEDMRTSQGFQYADRDLEKMEKDYESYLRDGLVQGHLLASVAEVGGNVVGSGCVSILAWPPCPGWPPSAVGLIHSIYTAPQYRKQGIAEQIIQALIKASEAKGCRKLTMGGRGTNAGRHLYETLGFVPSENMQRIL